MYLWKYDKLTLRGQKEAGEVIGVTPQWLCNVCGRKVTVRKILAYSIVKYIDENAEIEDYFVRIDKIDKGE